MERCRERERKREIDRLIGRYQFDEVLLAPSLVVYGNVRFGSSRLLEIEG